MTPIKAMETNRSAPFARVKVGLRNRASGRIGWLAFVSASTKAASPAAEKASRPKIRGEPHP